MVVFTVRCGQWQPHCWCLKLKCKSENLASIVFFLEKVIISLLRLEVQAFKWQFVVYADIRIVKSEEHLNQQLLYALKT